MTKQEFEKIYGGTVTDKEYTVIEYVYTWHPAIPAATGKQKIVTLFEMGVVSDMLAKAQKAEILQGKMMHLRNIRDQAIQDLQDTMREYDEL